MNKAFKAAAAQTTKKLKLMKEVMLEEIFKEEKKRYYREWLKQCGWGVMLAYDTVMVSSKYQAEQKKPSSMYAYDELFENVTKVKKKHLELSDHELSKIYGEKEK